MTDELRDALLAELRPAEIVELALTTALGVGVLQGGDRLGSTRADPAPRGAHPDPGRESVT